MVQSADERDYIMWEIFASYALCMHFKWPRILGIQQKMQVIGLHEPNITYSFFVRAVVTSFLSLHKSLFGVVKREFLMCIPIETKIIWELAADTLHLHIKYVA